MKKIRITFLCFLCILVLFATVAPAFAADDSFPQISSQAALLIDQQTGRALFSKNADKRVYPASLTKIMTALLALESVDLNDMVTVQQSALEGLDPSGTSAGLKVGEILSINDLLHCILVYSANDASNVIAEYVSGDISAFVTRMNERAVSLGCTGTNFTNTHGLHDEEHYTTVHDLYLITEAALEHETFRQICDKASCTIGATNLSAERRFHTSNYLISTQTREDYYYSYASGIKTGFTTPAGRCLISCANNGTLDLLVILCGAATKVDSNGNLLIESFTDAKTLFEYGFSSFRTVTLLSPLEPLGKLPVSLSSQTASVVYAPAETISALLPKDYDAALIEWIISLDNEEGIQAPVARGQRLGEVQVYYNGEIIGSTELLAIADIERSFAQQIGSQISRFFHSSAWNVILSILLFLILALVITLLILYFRARRNRKRRQDRRRRAQMLRRMRGGDSQ